MISNICPSSSITGYQFESYNDCIEAGYKIAYNKYKNLEELEEFDKEFIEEKKIVVKFECKDIRVNAI
tara:strand:+ start:175 stop:378 length:204 start_codon:yes stop_codon:yes gene_type:complete